ncbi:MAG: segregation/condensation protein A [bacterium]
MSSKMGGNRREESQNTIPTKGEYRVVLDVFEGPLDLLMHLIKKEKIDIYDISITKITDQYLAFLETMTILNLDITSEFLVMAATLIYMKSQTLLTPKAPHEEEELEEQKRDLVDRLLEYQRYKEAAENLCYLAEERSRLFSRPAIGTFSDGDFSTIEAGIFDLVLALRGILHKVPADEPVIPLKVSEIDIKDRIRQILISLRFLKSALFEELLEGKYERQNIIITFLALLEMAKTGMIRLKQPVPFGEITVAVAPVEERFPV